MEKKTKLWLGAGILGVGAYLLWKSKQAATATVASTTAAKFVGANAESKFFNPETKKYGHGEGVFANANANQEIKSSFFDVKSTPEGVFKNATASKKHFANQPFSFAGDGDPVGQRKMPFADKVGKNEKFNAGGPKGDGQANFKMAGGPKQGNFKQALGKVDSITTAQDTFFSPRTAPYGPNQGVFAPSAPKTAVMPKMVTQAAPTKMLVGANGMINGPAVYSVWGKQ
jgi:hypothetical protein